MADAGRLAKLADRRQNLERAGARRHVIAAPSCPADTLLTHRRDPDRRAGLLHRCRRHAYVAEFVVFATMAELLAGEAALNDRQSLEGAPKAFVDRDPEGVK